MKGKRGRIICNCIVSALIWSVPVCQRCLGKKVPLEKDGCTYWGKAVPGVRGSQRERKSHLSRERRALDSRRW